MDIQILLLHYPVVQKVFKRSILSEVPEAEITTLATPEEMGEALREKKFSIIMSGRDILIDNDPVWIKTSERFPVNGKTPIVVLTSGNETQSVADLAAQGIEHTLVDPTSIDLGRKIRALCDSKNQRTNERYFIPDTTVRLEVRHTTISAGILNLSVTGAFIDMAYTPDMQVLHPYPMTLEFPAMFDHLRVTGLRYKVIRSQPLSWTEDGFPEMFQLAVHFLNRTDTHVRDLTWVIDKVERELYSF